MEPPRSRKLLQLLPLFVVLILLPFMLWMTRTNPAQGRIFGLVVAARPGPDRQYRDDLGVCILRLARSQGPEVKGA